MNHALRRNRIWVITLLVLWVLSEACSLTRWTGLARPAESHPETTQPTRTARPTRTSAPKHSSTPTSTPTSMPTPTPTQVPVVQMVVEKIAAPSLEGNLLGDADEQYVQVYLPPSYADADLHYPVVYFLPSFGSDAEGKNEYFSAEKLAAMMDSAEIREMILVVPNGANALHGSFFVNSPVTGNWEDFIVQDVVGYVDEHYRTITSQDGRGIAGHSMGGFGAINLAMRHADLFGAAYGLSPALFDPNGLGDSLMFDAQEKERVMLAHMDELSKLPPEKALKEMKRLEGPAGFTMAYGTAFAGSAEVKPPFFSLPYEERSGKLKRIPQEWERWQNGFGGWEAKIAEYHDSLAGLKGLVIDYGSEDLPWIVTGSEYLSKQLEAAGIPHRLESFDGTHGSQIEERLMEVMLPFFDEALAGPR